MSNDVTIRIGVEGAGEAAGEIERVGGAARETGSAFDTLAEKALAAFAFERVAASVAEWTREAERLGDVMVGLGGRSSEAATVMGVQLLSSLDAVSARTRLLNADLDISDQQFQALQLHAAAYAATTGQEVAPVLDRLTGALISGSERGMRPFGFALQEGATRAQNQAAALDAMTAALQRNQQVVRDSTGALDMWDGVLLRTKERVGAFAQGLLEVPFQTFNDAVRAGENPLEAMIDRLVRLSSSFSSLTGGTAGATETLWAYRRAVLAAATATGGAAGQISALLGGGAPVADLPTPQESFATGGGLAAAPPGMTSAESAATDMVFSLDEAEGGGGRRRGGGGGGGGGRRGGHPDDYYEQIIERRQRERESADRARAADVAAQMGEARDEWSDREARGRAPRGDSRPMNRPNVARQDATTKRAAQEIDALADTYERLGDRGTKVVDALGAAWESHFAAFAKGKESFGEAMRAMTASVLEAIAAQSLKEAAFQFAKGIAALASFNYGGAALHFAAAAGFGALAFGGYAAAGAIEGGGARASSAARDSGGDRNSTRDLGPSRGGGEQSGGGVSVTYVLSPNSLVMESNGGLDRLADLTARAIRTRQRRVGRDLLERRA